MTAVAVAAVVAAIAVVAVTLRHLPTVGVVEYVIATCVIATYVLLKGVKFVLYRYSCIAVRLTSVPVQEPARVHKMQNV